MVARIQASLSQQGREVRLERRTTQRILVDKVERQPALAEVGLETKDEEAG